MSDDFKDHFSGHADLYRRYRPVWPAEVFTWLASLVTRRERAWDVGTGNGQAAHGLAAHFAEVVASDASASQIAEENDLPTISLVESGGADLPTQKDIFIPGGKMFRDLTRASARKAPTIALVFGNSTAGGAYIPGMSDYTVFVKEQAKVFLGGPPLVKMATGEESDDESLGGNTSPVVLSSSTSPLPELPSSPPLEVPGSGAAGGSSSMPITVSGDHASLPAQSVATDCSVHTPGGTAIDHDQGGLSSMPPSFQKAIATSFGGGTR